MNWVPQLVTSPMPCNHQAFEYRKLRAPTPEMPALLLGSMAGGWWVEDDDEYRRFRHLPLTSRDVVILTLRRQIIPSLQVPYFPTEKERTQ